MLGNRFNGDSIAQEYQRILEERAKIIKESQELFESPIDDPVEAVLNPDLEAEATDVEPSAESFLMSTEVSMDDISGALDGSIDSMEALAVCKKCAQESCACDPSMAEDAQLSESDYFDATAGHILNGLGKIAGSLRVKGHGFASDIVETTAMSIKDDFVKEASDRLHVVSELQKMAKELTESGNQIASDMVLVTIEKIKKA